MNIVHFVLNLVLCDPAMNSKRIINTENRIDDRNIKNEYCVAIMVICIYLVVLDNEDIIKRGNMLL